MEMFRPPIAAVKAIGWTQVFGFAQGHDPFWARVRAAQLTKLTRYVPLNVGLILVNVLSTATVLYRPADATFMAGWSGALGCLALLWSTRWLRQRGRPEVVEVGIGEFWRVSAEIVAFGVCWAALVAHLMGTAVPEQQAVLVVMSLTAMGACAFATAIVPVGGMVLVFVIGVTTLASLPAASPIAHWLIWLAFGSFMLLIARGMMLTSFAMMARMRTQAELTEQSEVIGLLLSEFEANGSDWLLEIDADGALTHVSPRFAQVAGRQREDLLGQPLIGLLGNDRRGAETRAAVRDITAHFYHERPFRDVVVPVVIAGEPRWWQLSGTPKLDSAGRFSGYRGVGSDITVVRTSHDRIAHLARFDPLTGLANRNLVREAIDDALQRGARTGGTCALLFIDLDRFKLVNDTLGHLAGDRLLREVATRLRQATGARAHIGRLGGDEFAVVLADTDLEEAKTASAGIVAALAQPFTLDDQTVTIGASVGYALGPDDGATTDLLLRSADLALYEVKGAGRGHACRFVVAIQEKADERRALEFDLRSALANGELALAFQPVVDAADERIVGFEALLRWQHPRLGAIPPLKFVPIAEETGLIVRIGQWVIEEACRWAALWPADIRIAVNLSPLQFEDPHLAEIVAGALAEHGITPDRLELEVTESLFMNEQASTIAMLAELKALGIRFALDDFGTGYSSLGYLRKAAFSRIKIDRSFVSRATVASGESFAIIQAIVALAQSLGMATTAEGTETREEFEAIRDLGCNQVQGYLFGRPMSAAAATALVAPRVRLAAVA